MQGTVHGRTSQLSLTHPAQATPTDTEWMAEPGTQEQLGDSLAAVVSPAAATGEEDAAECWLSTC